MLAQPRCLLSFPILAEVTASSDESNTEDFWGRFSPVSLTHILFPIVVRVFVPRCLKPHCDHWAGGCGLHSCNLQSCLCSDH